MTYDASMRVIDTEFYLYGVIVHAGDANYGHYWIFLLVRGVWFKFNDSNTTEVIILFGYLLASVNWTMCFIVKEITLQYLSLYINANKSIMYFELSNH